MGSERRRALFALLAVTVVWGLSFPWTKQALDCARAIGSQSSDPVWVERLLLVAFTGLRFGAGFLALCLWNRTAGRSRPRGALGTLRPALLLGGLLITGMLINSEGLRNLEPAVAAFLTSLYVLFTALFFAVSRRRWPHPALGLGVLLATLGAALIDGPPQVSFGLPQGLTILSAMLFAGQILAIDRFAIGRDPLRLTEGLFAVCTLGAAIVLAGLWARAPQDPWPLLRTFMAAPDFQGPLLRLVLLATLFALTAMQVFQRYLDPVRAAILYALEPVWAALHQAGFAPQGLDRWAILGGSLVLLGNLIAELLPRVQHKRSHARSLRTPGRAPDPSGPGAGPVREPAGDGAAASTRG